MNPISRRYSSAQATFFRPFSIPEESIEIGQFEHGKLVVSFSELNALVEALGKIGSFSNSFSQYQQQFSEACIRFSSVNRGGGEIRKPTHLHVLGADCDIFSQARACDIGESLFRVLWDRGPDEAFKMFHGLEVVRHLGSIVGFSWIE